MKATWNNTVIAESDDTVIVEGNHYFPRESIKAEYYRESDLTSSCPWKGDAAYFDVVVGDDVNEAAAWHYDSPKTRAENIAGHVAFWRGVVVSD